MCTVCVNSKALLIRPLLGKHVVHSLPTCQLVFHIQIFIFIFSCVDRAPCMCDWDKPRSTNENTTNLERVLYLCLTLDWRWSDVLLASTFTSGKTLTFLHMQKMCAEVDAYNKWITFIRRSRQIISGFWRTLSESQRTDQHSSFLVRWTYVMVCVTGP